MHVPRQLAGANTRPGEPASSPHRFCRPYANPDLQTGVKIKAGGDVVRATPSSTEGSGRQTSVPGMDNVIEKLRAGDALNATTAMHGRSRTHPLLPCRVLAGGVFALLAAAVLAAPGPAGGGQECRVVPSGSPWYRASSEHFSVLGNVPSKVVASACTQLERTLSALTAVWSLRLEGDSQVEVLLLPFGSSFDTLTSALLGDPVRRMSSLTLVRRYETSIVASVGVAMPLEVSLAHELTHALVRGTIPRPPYWLDEGLAEFFETLEIKGSTVKVGLPAQDHVYRLRKKVWYPFSELLYL